MINCFKCGSDDIFNYGDYKIKQNKHGVNGLEYSLNVSKVKCNECSNWFIYSRLFDKKNLKLVEDYCKQKLIEWTT